jgi:hypothetical protein
MSTLRAYLYSNRQAITNTLGVALVFSGVMQNMKMRSELESKLNAMNEHFVSEQKIQLLLDDKWLRETEEKIKSKKSSLFTEISIRLQQQPLNQLELANGIVEQLKSEQAKSIAQLQSEGGLSKGSSAAEAPAARRFF